MEERVDASLAGKPQAVADGGSGERLAEERASRILERAAVLDAKRTSEIEVGELREAAVAAGISREAFDQAMQEQADSASDDGAHGSETGAARSQGLEAVRAPGAGEVAHYAALLRDLMGEDGQVVVVEDRIECSDGDGLTVTISPSSGSTTAAVTAVGKLSRRLLGSSLPLVIPGLFGLMVVRVEEDIGFGMFFGVLMAAVVSVVGGIISHRREQKALRKKSEQVRRQLQRMLDTLPDKS